MVVATYIMELYNQLYLKNVLLNWGEFLHADSDVILFGSTADLNLNFDF